MPAATGITATAPGAGSVNIASTPIALAASPVGGTITGTETLTPVVSGVTGTFNPATLGLTTGTPSGTMTFTPTAEGTATITFTDSNGLTMPGAITYVVVGAVPALEALAGDAINPPRGSSISIVPNTYAPILVTISSLPAPVTAATLNVGISAAAEFTLTKAALIVDPGTLQGNGTYTAKVLFVLVEADTAKLPAGGQAYVGQVIATANVGGVGRTVAALDALNWTSIVG